MVNRNFIPFPILTADRLTLRQLSTADKQNIFTLRSCPEINKYLDRQPSNTIEDAINFINAINNSIKKNDSLYWTITLTNSKTFVGTICLFNFSAEKNSCEIGYELLTDFQRQGIMKEAAEKVIDYVFDIMKLQKIQAFTHVNNQYSTKLLEKLDFKKSAGNSTESPEYINFTLTNEVV